MRGLYSRNDYGALQSSGYLKKVQKMVIVLLLRKDTQLSINNHLDGEILEIMQEQWLQWQIIVGDILFLELRISLMNLWE